MNAETKVKAATLPTAMSRAFAAIEAATKSANNPHYKSKYADLGAVIEAVKPALIANDLFFTQRCRPCEGGVSVETVLHHANGESMELGTLFVPANKNDAQGFGSALTYARRYGLLTAFGVPTEDDDGNAAARSVPRADQAPRGQQPVLIRDQERDLIATLAPSAGKTVQEICEAYKVASLKELTAAQGEKLIDRLRQTAHENRKEPANA
jgi:hypothetical protein